MRLGSLGRRRRLVSKRCRSAHLDLGRLHRYRRPRRPVRQGHDAHSLPTHDRARCRLAYRLQRQRRALGACVRTEPRSGTNHRRRHRDADVLDGGAPRRPRLGREDPSSRIPNRANLDPAYLGLPWDEGATHHLPWQAGITGIAYDIEATGRELGSFADLFDPEFAGRVGLLSEMEDTVGLTMLMQGRDPSVLDIDGANAALDHLATATRDGQIRVHGERVPRPADIGRVHRLDGMVG
ncbi:MAG: ABC transporter substrate-binding protein [Actinobacteria bacterium]|nr:ABC transporter substrate-binding protein [Actinomycetota bacterium]